MNRRQYVLGAATLLAAGSLPALAQRGDDDDDRTATLTGTVATRVATPWGR